MIKTMIKITQTRSSIGRLPKHKKTLIGLGLRRIGHTVEREDTPSIRGMIKQLSYMIKVIKKINVEESK
ncbi:50S ribosomal protein L30 [Candidatus Fukatsuia anoeciicola]